MSTLLPFAQPFDHAKSDKMAKRAVVAPGDYIAKIVSSSVEQTANKLGTRLVLNCVIAAGDNKDTSFMVGLNIENVNPKAVELALKELATLSAAIGVPPFTDAAVLHDRPFVVTLKVVPATGKYGAKNEPVYYASAAGLATHPAVPKPSAAVLAIMAGEGAGTTEPQSQAQESPPAGWADDAPPVEGEIVPSQESISADDVTEKPAWA